MGQYYKPLNPTKREFLYSHNYDNGLKLMEHSYVDNNFVRAVEALIGEGGAWYGDVVRWEGDYADKLPDSEENYYGEACSYAELHPDPIPKSRRFALNLTKKLYVDIEKCPGERHLGKIHPLPLLICNGNGRGGGDYSGSEPRKVGSWCGDVVSTSDTIPEGYTEFWVAFNEFRF